MDDLQAEAAADGSSRSVKPGMRSISSPSPAAIRRGRSSSCSWTRRSLSGTS